MQTSIFTLAEAEDAASSGLLRRAVVRLASGQLRGRQEKAAKQRTDRVTVAHMFSVYEKGLSDLKAEPATRKPRRPPQYPTQRDAQILHLVPIMSVAIRTAADTACRITVAKLAASFVGSAPRTELRTVEGARPPTCRAIVASASCALAGPEDEDAFCEGSLTHEPVQPSA